MGMSSPGQGGFDQPAGQQTQDKTDQLAQQAKDKASDVMQQAQDTAKSQLQQQKGRAADSVSSVAQALHQTGQNLQNQDQGGIAQAIEQVASRLDQFSNDLQNKSVDEMFYDVQDFARRDPQLFLGGAVVLGLLAARFFKASSQRQQQYRYGQQYGRGYGAQQYGTGYTNAPRSQGYTERDLADYRRQTMRDEYTGSYPPGSTSADYDANRDLETGYIPGEQDYSGSVSTGAGRRGTGYPASGQPGDFGTGAGNMPTPGAGMSEGEDQPDENIDRPDYPRR